LKRQALQSEMDIDRHRSLAQMVAGVAHELNTPLGIINTASSLIKSELGSPDFSACAAEAPTVFSDIVEAAALIEGNISRAHHLIQTFKHLSVSQITDTREVVDLNKLVRDVVSLFKINARQAKLDIQIHDLPDAAWDGYPGYMSQALLNLLTNIERYAYPDQTGGRVEIRIAEQNDRQVPSFAIEVQDFGAGIAPENLPRIFEMFFTTGRIKGGTGLGLAIVYNIITTVLRGSVAVQSEPGKGACFRLVFPRVIGDR
jgi:signal transduction histidine kinase